MRMSRAVTLVWLVGRRPRYWYDENGKIENEIKTKLPEDEAEGYELFAMIDLALEKWPGLSGQEFRLVGSSFLVIINRLNVHCAYIYNDNTTQIAYKIVFIMKVTALV